MPDERQIAEGRIAWTRRHMPILVKTLDEFAQARPFDGTTLGFRLHIEPKTAVLIETLLAGGAQIIAMGNEGTTQFGTADVVADMGCEVLDRPGQGPEATAGNLVRIASAEPQLVLDNGAELIAACLANRRLPVGATEETTSGAFRLREDHAGNVAFPVIVINDSPLKSIVENKHGVGESVVDTVVRVTNMSFHKKRVAVYGYGWCGRGIALYAERRGADVTVYEIDPIMGLEAAMDGFDVADPSQVPADAEVVITATGRPEALDYRTIEQLRDGVLLANAGHSDTEIDVAALEQSAAGVELSPSLKRHEFPDGKTVFCIAGGKIVNLAAHGGIGNPIEAMDLGLTLQARSLAALVAPDNELDSGPQPVPSPVNGQVATAMLHSMGQTVRTTDTE
ncbi:MAG: adenosylhomocysteinase [Acidimicrobiia bacterium]